MKPLHALTLRRLLLATTASLWLAACGGTRPSGIRSEGEFPRENLRTASSLLVVSPDAKVIEFEGSFDKVYGDADAFASALTRALVDSLNKGAPSIPIKRATWKAPADSIGLSVVPGPDSAILEAGARYVLRVRNVTVTNALRELPVVDLPGPGAYERTGGGTSESCVVSFEVEIWDTEGVLSRKHSFVATGRSDVFLWAYKSALKEAVRRAVRETALYLRGS